ncbi:hypothetical protein C8R46DRAFT_1030657 [Mycena filopes]|nr:hypothetical protein C8R46DRAFT_1030657 [Mycena filopes]
MTPSPSMASTYGSWLISLFLVTILYGVGILQAFLYYHWWPADPGSIRYTVSIVTYVGVTGRLPLALLIVSRILETIQLTFFFRSSYFRFVEKFGTFQQDLIWSDSVNFLYLFRSVVLTHGVACNTASTFRQLFSDPVLPSTTVTRELESARFTKASRIGPYAVGLLATIQLSAGAAQTVILYKLRSFTKLKETTPVTTLQTAASLLCDIVITVHLCMFLARSGTGMATTERMLKALMRNAINRGLLTAITSATTLILFLVFPTTFWFFLPMAPNSKLSELQFTTVPATYLERRIWKKDVYHTIITTRVLEKSNLDYMAKSAHTRLCQAIRFRGG